MALEEEPDLETGFTGALAHRIRGSKVFDTFLIEVWIVLLWVDGIRRLTHWNPRSQSVAA